MFKNKGELAIALSAERVFKDKYGTVMKFDPLGKEECSSPFVCKHKHSDEWVVMTGCWLEYETVKEIFPGFADLLDLPDLLRDTQVKVAQTLNDNFVSQYFSHFNEDGDMWCYEAGTNSYTSNGGKVALWKFWRVYAGPHEGTRNYNNKENKNV